MVMLVLIQLGDKAYGVPISKELKDRTGREAALGSVYAALDRVGAKGLRRFRRWLIRRRNAVAGPSAILQSQKKAKPPCK